MSTTTNGSDEESAGLDQSFTDFIDCGRYCAEIEPCSKNDSVMDDDTHTLEGEHIIQQMKMKQQASKNRLEKRMEELFPNSNFDLDKIHPHEPPYLGTSYWQPIPTHSPSSSSRNLMNVAPLTPPRTIEHPINKQNTPPTSPLISPTSSTTPSKQYRRSLFDNGQHHHPHHHLDSTTQQHPEDHNIVASPFLLHNAHTISTPRVRSLGDSSSSTIRTSTTTSTMVTEATSPLVSFTPRRLFGDREELLFQQPHNGDDHDVDCYWDNDHSLNPSSSKNEMSEAAMVAASRADFCGEVEYSTSIQHVHQALDPCSCNNASTSTPPTSPGGNANVHQNEVPPSPTYHYNDDEESIITFRNGLLVKKTIYSPSKTSCDASRTSTLTTVHIPDGRRKSNRQHVNTLPSLRVGKPIRLRVTESYAGYSSPEIVPGEANNGDGCGAKDSDALNESGVSGSSLLTEEEAQQFFSYDPYFSSGEYTVTKPSGRPYGNGLSVKMGEQYMTLQDLNGRVWAVTRSRHTFVPSSVIYSPKPRYEGQIPSSHRPYSERGEGVEGEVDLYPWAIIKKDGRRMDHDATIHLVSTNAMDMDKKKLIGGIFDPKPSYRSRHGFDDNGGHSHTMVYRVESSESNEDNESCEEVPCCILLRDEVKRDVFDVTIAPGIDPLLIICYMAVHSKMDVEPKLCDL